MALTGSNGFSVSKLFERTSHELVGMKISLDWKALTIRRSNSFIPDFVAAENGFEDGLFKFQRRIATRSVFVCLLEDGNASSMWYSRDEFLSHRPE